MITLRKTTAMTALLSAAVFTGAATAAPINYGDFSGTTVMYLDVTETANTPDDTEPLFGPPTIAGNQLDFDPAGFAASGTDGNSDLTDGQLNFMLMAAPGSVITSFSIEEGGDFSLFGVGSTATQVAYGVSIASITVTEVDGVSILPVDLGSASAFGSADLVTDGPVVGAAWDLSLFYDVNAALADAGVSFTAGATKLEIVINDTLIALSEDQSAAFIAKKDFDIDVNTDIPEPGSLALLGLGGLLLARRRRNG